MISYNEEEKKLSFSEVSCDRVDVFESNEKKKLIASIPVREDNSCFVSNIDLSQYHNLHIEYINLDEFNLGE